ncbi:unnamed protein product [Larinioides sclopetarius]|uniref:VPS37 C-terminal domain-containing protein n=1 Tax=Larinioides sclopetarius TaxID=280406 RepID=A0AAV2BDG9_9ARAC
MNSSLFSPDYSHLTGLLQHLNDDELKELLNNEEKMKALVSDLKQVHDIEAEREMLFASNKSISEYNLSKKPIIEDHKKQLDETRKIAIELKDSLLEKKKKIESYQENTSKETVLALLQAATLEKEEEAEAAVRTFLNNELSADDFLLKYLEVRKMAHLRRTKAEKMANLLQENGSRIPTPPVRSQKLRKPPPPPTTNTGAPNVFSYPNRAAQNMIPPIRSAQQPGIYNNMPAFRPTPQQPGTYNNVSPAPYPPGAAYFPNQMRPPVPPFGYNQYPGYQYSQPARFGHFK